MLDNGRRIVYNHSCMKRLLAYTEMDTAALITLLRHNTAIAAEISEELAKRDLSAEASTGRALQESALDEQGAPGAATKRDAALIEAVLDRAVPQIREAATTIITRSIELKDVGEAIPERPWDKKPPTYVRLTRGRTSFAYLHVRRDHLRIDLAIPPDDAERLTGEVRVREVQEDNPWKVSVYVRDLAGVASAIEAIEFSYGKLREVAA